MGEVDSSFIQAPEDRPNLSPLIQAQGIIPIIDLSNDTVSSIEEKEERLVKAIGKACKEWGFFQVINHGVPLSKRQSIEEASRRFFSQKSEEKKKVSRDQRSRTGYYDTNLTNNVRDWKEVFDFVAKEPTLSFVSGDEDDDRITELTNKYPQYPPNLREVIQEYVDAMEKLALRLMELIALSLGLEPKRFHGFFEKNQSSFIRLNHYPPCPSPHLALGIGRHKDPIALTILAQDEVEGLEVKRKSDGKWIRVKPMPNSYIINVGDIIQVWSNDGYESVEHRVSVNSKKDRFSIAYFFNPAHDTIVEPLEEIISEENPPKYRPCNWGKFLINRKKSNLNVKNLQFASF